MCSKGEQISADSKTAKRTCAACPAGTFQATAAHRISPCIAWTVCANGEYEQRNGTASTDRVCGTHASTCGANEYELRAPTATSDRLCTGAGTCANGALIALALRTQANHCGTCSAGYYLDAATKSCVSCPSDTYLASSSPHSKPKCDVQPTCGKGEQMSAESKTARRTRSPWT